MRSQLLGKLESPRELVTDIVNVVFRHWMPGVKRNEDMRKGRLGPVADIVLISLECRTRKQLFAEASRCR